MKGSQKPFGLHKYSQRSALFGFVAGFAKFKMEVALSSDGLEVYGDWAFNRGKTSGRLTWHDGSTPTPLNDKYLMILRRQADQKQRRAGNLESL